MPDKYRESPTVAVQTNVGTAAPAALAGMPQEYIAAMARGASLEELGRIVMSVSANNGKDIASWQESLSA